MSRLASIGEIAEVNPIIPKDFSTSSDKPVTFLPMAAVSEEGRIVAPEVSLMGRVIKGYRYFEQGDVLLAKITPCMENGKAAFAKDIPYKIGFGSTEFHVLRPRSEVDGWYLFYMVWNPIFRYIAEQNMTGTAGQRRIPTDFVRRYKIPLPPLEDQRRIATILDKTDAIRRKRQKAIRLTEELLRSIFLEMFGDPITNPKGWKVTTLGNLLLSIDSGWSPKCDSRKAQVEEWGVLKLGAVTWGYFNPLENKALLPSIPPHPELEVKPGDLLFSRKNTYELVGASAFVHATRSKLMLPDLIFRLRLVDAVDPAYVWQSLSQKTMRTELSRLASGSAGSMPNISKARLRTLPFPVPPLEIQSKYREIVSQLWKKQGHQKASLLSMDELFNSLLQRAFRGEL